MEPEALLILLTQDCDILHHDYEAEPNIEIHIARPVPEEDGNLFHAKNPRRLQFSLGQLHYEVEIHEKCTAPRECLIRHVPLELHLEENQIRTIIGWTANRYLRSAFPDAFNERLYSAKQAMRRIEGALKSEGSLVTGIFLQVDPNDEINEEEQYRVILRITAKEDVLEQPDLERRAIQLTETVRQELGSVAGIQLIDYALVSHAEFTLADLLATMRWDYDYLSYKAGTPDNAVPTGA